MTYLASVPYRTYGIALWYSVDGAAEISHSLISERLDSAGLSVKLPARTSAVNAFRKACGTGIIGKAKKPDWEGPPFDVLYSAQVNDEWNGAKFNLKKDGTISLSDIGYWTWSDESSVVQKQLEEDFERYRNNIDSTLLRQLIPTHLLSLGAVRIRSGLFFLEIKHAKHVESLTHILNSEIHHMNMGYMAIPVDSQQLTQLNKTFYEYLVELHEELQAKDLLEKDNPPQKLIDTYFEKYNLFRSETERLSGILEITLARSEVQFAIDMHRQITEKFT